LNNSEDEKLNLSATVIIIALLFAELIEKNLLSLLKLGNLFA
jgi:hypothetical protein